MPKLPDLDPDNTAQRCPVMLLIDTSGSMQGDRINAVNSGLAALKAHLADDPVAKISVELAVMTFNSKVSLVRDFSSLQEFEPPVLTAEYQTFLGEGVTQALSAINDRKRMLKDAGLPYYRPLLFIFTDGNPEGELPTVIEDAQRRLAEATKRKEVEVFPIGIGDGIDLDQLTRIAGKQALRLDEAKWAELFKWLSASVAAVSRSAGAGNQAALPVPGWAQFSTN